MSSKSSKSARASKSDRASKSSKSNKSLYNIPQAPTKMPLISIIINIIWQAVILYYLYNLEGAECVCKNDWNTDWRHKYIKIYTISMLCFYVLVILFASIQHIKIISILYTILGFINIYALFTYINDININKCNCAVEKQYYLNNTIKFVIWFTVIVFIISLLFILANMLSMLIGTRPKA